LACWERTEPLICFFPECAHLYVRCRHDDRGLFGYSVDLQQPFHWFGARKRRHHGRSAFAIYFAIYADERDLQLIVVGTHADAV
jgi:hypothetical protein